MKIFLLIGLCFCLFLIGFYLGKNGSSIDPTLNDKIGNLNEIDTDEQAMNERKEILLQQLIETNFPVIMSMNSSTGAYIEFQSHLPLIESIIKDGNASIFYKSAGTDVFIEMAYLCHMMESSKNLSSLKKVMKTATGLILISGDEVHGGKNNVIEYNKTILSFIEDEKQGYDIFYKNFQVVATAIGAADIPAFVKDLSKVVMTIYAAGEQKYVYNKPIDCRKILIENFSLLQQKK